MIKYPCFRSKLSLMCLPWSEGFSKGDICVWERWALVTHPLPILSLARSLARSLSLSLSLARALFSSSEPQTRAARSIRIDCPWRAAPLSSQCQPVCDREGEKWRKISAALAVSFPHTSFGRLPADRTFKRSGVDWAKPGAERPQLTPVYHSRPHNS